MELFAPIPYKDWLETKETLHRFLQIVGKIRLTASVRRNHWWNVPFHVTGRGITTRPMIHDPIFTIDFDFVEHRLYVHSLPGETVSFPLATQSVASFNARTFEALHSLGIDLDIAKSHPFDLPDEDRPFAHDDDHAAYDPAWVSRYWQVLSQVNLVLEEFAAGYSGKISPVHHFWHTLDIAVSRFSDRRIDHSAETDPVTREAYSREVISAGFWFGDDKFPEPAFYSYTAPEPEGLSAEPLQPEGARWIEQGGSHLAILRYDDARSAADSRRAVLAFLESSYLAGARRAGWDVDRFACPDGATDPVSSLERSD